MGSKVLVHRLKCAAVPVVFLASIWMLIPDAKKDRAQERIHHVLANVKSLFAK